MDDESARLPHEPSVVRVGAVATGVAAMVGAMLLALAAAAVLSSGVPSPRGSPGNAERPSIAGAVQRTAPPLELAAFRREKRARLEGRGVDPDTHEAFIPIEEAMKGLVADSARGHGGAR